MKVHIDLDVNYGEWSDDMHIECDSFEHKKSRYDEDFIIVNGAKVELPSICRVIECKIIKE